MGVEKIFGTNLGDLGVKVNKLPKQDTIYFVPMIKWEPLIQSLQNSIGIPPSSCFPTD